MFISNAYAEAAAGAAPGGFMEYLPLVALVAVFYFLVLRPQQTRVKEHKIMVEALQRGDEVVTIGGELARVSKVYEAYVAIELADNVEVTVEKIAIQKVLPKGTIKSIK